MIFGIYNPPENAEQSWAELKIGDINDAVEWDYTRYFCGVGTFSLVIPRTSNYADKIAVGCFLIVRKSKKEEYDGFIVKNIRYENDTLKITGYDLNGLLVDRITVAKTDDGKDAQSGATETIVKHYVSANCVEAEDAERIFPALYIADDQARGNPSDAASPRLSRVSDIIADILGAAGMGYRIFPDLSQRYAQLFFEVYEEVNRTDEQDENSRVIFAFGHGNISEMVRETGVTADRNTFYCELSDGLVTRYDKKTAGASDGSEAETVAENPEETTGAETSETTETAAFSGYNRREEFLELNCELSELEVYAEHEIADRYRETDSLEIVAGNPLDYGKIYNVGDIATVYDRRRDVKLNSVISAAEIKQTATEYSVKITLGDAKPKPLDLLGKNGGAVATVIRQGTMGVGMSSAWDITSEYFNNYSHNIAGTKGSTKYYAHAEGNYTKALGVCSHSEGYGTTASGGDSHAEGYGTAASGYYSHAEGSSSTASGTAAHSEGDSTKASGDYSHAEGYGATASGNYSHAEGNNTTASGTYSHAEGLSTSVSGNYCHVEGGYNTLDGGACSHVEGRENTVKEPETSHVSGARNTAEYINYSTVSGAENTVKSCRYTDVSGHKNTVTNAHHSLVSGEGNVVGGSYENNLTTIGYKLKNEGTNNSANAVFGQYNKPDRNLLFSVGNGAGEDARSNAFAVDAAGNIYITGDIYINGVKIDLGGTQNG